MLLPRKCTTTNGYLLSISTHSVFLYCVFIDFPKLHVNALETKKIICLLTKHQKISKKNTYFSIKYFLCKTLFSITNTPRV
uniref:Putative ovule protein n=1 Tax=Solanum chacoense TaxID=4108 RepID=A0A0V0HLG5_SOLCH